MFTFARTIRALGPGLALENVGRSRLFVTSKEHSNSSLVVECPGSTVFVNVFGQCAGAFTSRIEAAFSKICWSRFYVLDTA